LILGVATLSVNAGDKRGMRIAVLGCGSIGRRHLENLRTLGHVDLLAFDPASLTCEKVSKELGVSSYTQLKDIWSLKPNVVLVTAPTNLHVELALAASRHGCHLFIEKPLSHSLIGVGELCAEVELRNLTSMVGCNMRFHPCQVMVKKLIDNGAVGEAVAARIQSGSYLPRWRGSEYLQSYSASPEFGGAILDCIHEIDLALWYFGPAIVVGSVLLPAPTIGLETEGLAEILLQHRSGTLSSVHLNFVQRDYRRCCQIIGSEGTVYWDFEKHQVDVYGGDGKLDRVLQEPAGWQTNQMYLNEIAHFLECVDKKRATINPISSGLAALNIALAARQPHQQ